MPKVYLAADHAGYALKEALTPFLAEHGYEVEDCGAFALDPSDDYPGIIQGCARKVATDSGSFGIVMGGSGQGEAIAANRINGVRAVVYYGTAGMQTDAQNNELDIITSMRTHNDSNVLSLGARFLSEEEAKAVVLQFLTTSFSGDERHVRRIQALQ